jgi:hypothetical protein
VCRVPSGCACANGGVRCVRAARHVPAPRARPPASSLLAPPHLHDAHADLLAHEVAQVALVPGAQPLWRNLGVRHEAWGACAHVACVCVCVCVRVCVRACVCVCVLKLLLLSLPPAVCFAPTCTHCCCCCWCDASAPQHPPSPLRSPSSTSTPPLLNPVMMPSVTTPCSIMSLARSQGSVSCVQPRAQQRHSGVRRRVQRA